MVFSVPGDKQNLLYGGRNLDDKTTLGVKDIPEDSIMYRKPELVKVKLTLPSGMTRDVEILPSDTVITLKTGLQKLGEP